MKGHRVVRYRVQIKKGDGSYWLTDIHYRSKVAAQAHARAQHGRANVIEESHLSKAFSNKRTRKLRKFYAQKPASNQNWWM
jgi:hypothetical protein